MPPSASFHNSASLPYPSFPPPTPSGHERLPCRETRHSAGGLRGGGRPWTDVCPGKRSIPSCYRRATRGTGIAALSPWYSTCRCQAWCWALGRATALQLHVALTPHPPASADPPKGYFLSLFPGLEWSGSGTLRAPPKLTTPPATSLTSACGRQLPSWVLRLPAQLPVSPTATPHNPSLHSLGPPPFIFKCS